MRTSSDVGVEFILPGAQKFQRDTYLQSADSADLEEQSNAEFGAVAKLNLQIQAGEGRWFTLFVDIAGAGDGHPFMFRSYSAQTDEEDELSEASGSDPALLRAFFYLASQSEALTSAAKSVIPKIAALTEDDQIESVQVIQTGASGAAQGTRVCGFVLVNIVPVPPTVTSATLGTPNAGDLTIVGTEFLSTLPNTGSGVILNGAGLNPNPTALRRQAILDAGGTYTDTSIVIPASLIGGLAGGDTIVVTANGAVVGATVA
jgi:hypothetical protein